ncbi:hypothetical protein B0J11DRAFT_443946 [Dendryphion nanum]|uniref:Uncharacterized protein n=1 Tax=Dendryphion nanum TaxID=256645 RepID=A0A9P9IDN2_9PLEO|nr:hypothetical protein B0J11DRAFT_443946 [Dendryphion nanum]
MPVDIYTPPTNWLSGLRSCLRLLIIVLSGAVTGMLVHTMQIYRGNRSIDLRKGELPMTWPARTNLAPTLALFAVAAGNFMASVAIMALSFKRGFRRPIRSRDAYRVVAGSLGVILWATALVVFHLLDRANKASLGHYACANRNIMSNGRYQYRAVCSEQGMAFYIAIGAALAEFLTLLTLGLTALQSRTRSNSIIPKDDEKAKIEFRATARYP